jgi:hypothetical protein
MGDSDHSGTKGRRGLLKAGAAAALALVLPGAPRPAVRAPAHMATSVSGPRGSVRLDFTHALDEGVERFRLQRLRDEGRWTGAQPSAEAAVWGDYRFTLREAATGALLYREGFESTLDALLGRSGAALSLRCPLPAVPVEAAIEKRRAEGVFQTLWRESFDFAQAGIDRSPRAWAARASTLLSSGSPETKADIAILGDGYTQAEYGKFSADARRAAAYLFSVEPFRSRIGDFNVHCVFSPSAQSGVTDAYLGLERDTVLRSAYYAGGSERALAAGDNEALREIAAAVAYDFLLVLANARRYGGSAYFGGPAFAAIDSAAARYLVLHEFAHVIGGLADEYYVPTAYGPTYFSNIEPWQPNITVGPGRGKWRALLGEASLEPAHWNKTEYEREFADYVRRYRRLRGTRAPEREVEDLMREAAVRQRVLLAPLGARRRPGYYEGAHGYAHGVYRCEADCIMFSLQTDYFCAACSAAIAHTIDRHCV